jgi:hypothetical protein
MSASLFKRPDAGSLRLWILVCILPALAFAFLTSDVWFAPRSVLTGIVTSKSFKAESQNYGSMHLTLSGQPHDFAASMKIVALPQRRPASNYGAIKQGSTVSLVVFTRDIAGSPAGVAIPVLRIEQSGQSVFISGTLFLSWLTGAVLILAASGTLLGLTVRSDVLAASGAGRILRALDRPAHKIAQALAPVREFDTMERQIRHERALAIGRFGTFVALCVLVIAGWLLSRVI